MAQKKAQKSHAFKDLKDMHCYEEFHKKVKAGIAIEEIARWLQEDMLQQTAIKRDSLVRKLFRYKGSLPPAELLRDPPVYLQRAIEKMHRGINEIEELEKLYLFQLRRISIDAETETKINKLFGSTGHEIRIAMDLLNSMVQKKMELGIMSKVPDQLSVSGNFSSTLVDETTDEGTKARLGLLAGKMLQAMSKAIVEPAGGTEDTNE